MKKISRTIGGLLLLSIIGCNLTKAQGTADSFSSINLSVVANSSGELVLNCTNISSISSWSDDQLTTLVNALDATPTISTSDLPRGGLGIACWSLQNPNWPPLPGNTIGVDAWLMNDGNLLLNDLNFDYDAIPISPLRMGMMSASGVPFPGGGDGGDGTNDYSANGPIYIPPDYTTNLWIAQTGVASGNFTGIISNTTADVEMELQYTFDLTQPWQSANWFVYGSELTNWTAWNLPAVSSSNLFLRVRSWGVDAGGLPLWWEQQYGLTNVNPNALDSAGDGFTIYQKYQLGLNPSVFSTPAAPQGVVASLKQTAKTATISWLPSRGAVTGYIVEKIDSYGTWGGYYPPTVTDVNVSAASTSYQDNISANLRDPDNGNNYDLSYRVKALYSGGNSTAWSATIPAPQPTVSAFVAPGANGTTFLKVSGVPANATTVRLTFIDQITQMDGSHDPSFDFTQDIPVSAFNNGLYPLTTPWPLTDGYGGADFAVYAESVDTNGDESAATLCDSTWGDWPQPYNWGQPFYDGRAQLKQNLVFLLRAAPMTKGFHFWLHGTNGYDSGTFGAQTGPYNFPSNYVYSGLYPYYSFAYTSSYTTLDPYLPYEANALFRNFVYSSADVDDNGNLTTGVDTVMYGYTSLSRWPAYQFQTNGMALPNLLAPNGTRWLLFDADNSDLDSSVISVGLVNVNASGNLLSVSSGVRNWFGLPCISVNAVYQSYDSSFNPLGRVSTTVNAGASVSISTGDYYSISAGDLENIYPETAQPQFQTVKYCFYRPKFDWLPGSSAFTPTNDSPQLIPFTGATYATNDLPFVIVPVGTSTQIAGYAKLAVLNGYPGVYGYLGQYFDKAYKLDDSGEVTTNLTGFVSPYGSYFATDAGVAALVTMPDLDTGERGTCMVYSVSLQVDNNHDGNMNLSFNGPDATSTNSPFVLWCNNNFDRNVLDGADNELYDDDVLNTSQAAGCFFTPNTPTPDCNFLDGSGQRAIPNARDLEDFARLWVSGITSNLLAVLLAGSTITLTLTNVNGVTPTIDLFAAADADGGIGYLTNQMTSLVQTIEPYIGRLGSGQSIQLNSSAFANNWAGNHFIWCGVSNGTGGLNLTIKDSGGKVLAQSTSYIQITDIKQMYERRTLGDDPAHSPTNIAVLATEDLPVGTPAFQYPKPTSPTPYILFVHGWNMNRYDKDRFAETAFKRLYWQGYQGRFGAFRWPTDYGFAGKLAQLIPNPTERDNYDRSEYNAWQSSQGLLNTLTNLNGEYPDQVYMLAHSMGNIVASEALRLAGPQGLGRVVNTYVASQAAISAHTYDKDTNDVPNYSFSYPPWSASAATPNIYGNWFAQNNGAGAGQIISFYNRNDFALQRSAWQLNQLFKPDQSVMEGRLIWSYRYIGSANDPAPWNNFTKENDDFHITVNFDVVNVLTNRYEVMGYAAQSWTTALGATPGVSNLKRNVDLTSQDNGLWPTDPTGGNWTEHFWHSAEFRGDYWQQQGYWGGLLGSYGFNLR
ncbi:MAG: alpha/beta hydrolase [Negativicutes bacterium]|nr:alpha/beta hydrolase [Negativicutes bacterium]